jgi:Protein of unknown function (DUF2726)
MNVFLDVLSDAWGQMTGTLSFVARAFGENWRTGLAALPPRCSTSWGSSRSSPSRSAAARSGAGSDDRSHLLPERRDRDAFVNAVFAEIGVPLLRVKAQRSYSVAELRALFAHADLSPPPQSQGASL